MTNMANDPTPAICPGVKATPSNMRTIYALCIERFEALDMELRSLPTAQRKGQVAQEKACVETIIQLICNAGIAPFP